MAMLITATASIAAGGFWYRRCSRRLAREVWAVYLDHTEKARLRKAASDRAVAIDRKLNLYGGTI
jgi:hypothetical protein